MRPVYRTRTIYIPLTGSLKQGGEVAFPDQQDLKDAVVTSVETFTASDIETSPDGQAVVSDADALRLTVTITQQSDQRVKEVPYTAMRTSRNAGEPRQYDALLIEWTQCRIKITADLAALTPVAAAVCVGYYYPAKDQAATQRKAARR